MTCTVFETNSGCSSPVASRKIQVDFSDVPPSQQFHDFVDTVARPVGALVTGVVQVRVPAWALTGELN